MTQVGATVYNFLNFSAVFNQELGSPFIFNVYQQRLERLTIHGERRHRRHRSQVNECRRYVDIQNNFLKTRKSIAWKSVRILTYLVLRYSKMSFKNTTTRLGDTYSTPRRIGVSVYGWVELSLYQPIMAGVPFKVHRIFLLLTCLDGSAWQVVIGHVRFKGDRFGSMNTGQNHRTPKS
jgi:hypothetical protein